MNDSRPTHYELRVRGHLSARRLCCFGGLSVSHAPDGDTTIVGEFGDQAVLHGLLTHLRDLGVILVSINPVASLDED